MRMAGLPANVAGSVMKREAHEVVAGERGPTVRGGEWVEPATGDLIAVISPFTEDVVTSVPSASAADVDAAVSAARKAFDRGPWSRSTLQERVTVLARLCDLLVEDQELMASLITDEMGCPLTQSLAISYVM